MRHPPRDVTAYRIFCMDCMGKITATHSVETASIEEARDFLFAMLKAKGQLAQN